MTSFTIIGTGNMGDAIGGVLAAGGSDVTRIAHAEAGTAPLTGDVVVLAVPYGAVDGIIAAYGDQLAGKTVVDITNPLNFETFDSLVVPAGSSAAAQIQEKLPSSSVLKAFNTTFAGTLASKQVGGLPTTVLIAGDDTAAKDALAAAITAGGVTAIDAGALARAHELEALGFLQLTLAAGEKIAWTGGFAVAR
ncbi:NAD(P)-binding domain-containing protein [Actinotalea sp. BY-33]|uniref:NAD(P)-binding domain-containing protein n=1 Tax=Actinotalea soli TaxID=2819234 RepID=A0A939RSH8_9CELL|nr:NAD(P)-binding domain-containing protein [Actinotalea soli]MBO1751342.1 NAD(P)-binding domain-containing protein [Actinotalea soli]